MKVVRVITRDALKRPKQVGVQDASSEIEVVAERWVNEWHPVYAHKGDHEIQLPRGFEFNRDTLLALDDAE